MTAHLTVANSSGSGYLTTLITFLAMNFSRSHHPSRQISHSQVQPVCPTPLFVPRRVPPLSNMTRNGSLVFSRLDHRHIILTFLDSTISTFLILRYTPPDTLRTAYNSFRSRLTITHSFISGADAWIYEDGLSSTLHKLWKTACSDRWLDRSALICSE